MIRDSADDVDNVALTTPFGDILVDRDRSSGSTNYSSIRPWKIEQLSDPETPAGSPRPVLCVCA